MCIDIHEITSGSDGSDDSDGPDSSLLSSVQKSLKPISKTHIHNFCLVKEVPSFAIFQHLNI